MNSQKFTPFLLLVMLLFLNACSANKSGQEMTEIGIVYKSPACGCCGDWLVYMEEHRYTFQVENVQNLSPIKEQYHIPAKLQSCHTALVEGYIIEGHVPVAEVERLLSEKPDIAGIAVAGMPIGAPGMAVEGAAPQPFDVVAFDLEGNMFVFASYGE
jgi:hypothetical protein